MPRTDLTAPPRAADALPFPAAPQADQAPHATRWQRLRRGALLAALAAATALSGCGGGGSSATSPTAETTAPPNANEAARFLIQATYGPTTVDVAAVQAGGYRAWIDGQFSTPSLGTHTAYYNAQNICSSCLEAGHNAVAESFWRQAITGPDQLRQRVTFALSQIFVVSVVNSSLDAAPLAAASFLDTLSQHAFGNFRDLLEAVTLHPAMGTYLSHLGNDKENTATGRMPDENYAREVMQLFTIGLWELNEDGTRRQQNGQDIPTYGQPEVMGMAKVFTGWSWAGPDTNEGRWLGWVNGVQTQPWDQPMQPYPQHHSTSEKRILRGVVIPAGTGPRESLEIALDTLFNHPNVGPFIGRQLIQRLVTSNPSPAYIARVARAFNNNGAGVRGDMKAVIRAVLLDPEARDAAKLADGNWGKLREPVVRVANWARLFGARSPSGAYRINSLHDPIEGVGQGPLHSPSVFNFFRPDYSPAGDVRAAGLVAPEFQITHETTVSAYINFMVQTIEQGYGWGDRLITAPYTDELALANQPDKLVARLDQMLMAGQMSASTRQTIVEAVAAVPMTEANAAQRRVWIAVTLAMCSPEFLIQK
ncbi:MAG: DUF1800 domain-containing protein [Aquabacterium sp.]|nr:DUF1800 domain-containing protein [Aquabacterium sp.]